jgi:hypothetical protein
MTDLRHFNGSFIIEENKIKMNCLAKRILGLQEEYVELITIEDFLERINGVLDTIGFSTKLVDYDEFVKKNYEKESVYEYYILGAGNYYIYPRGTVSSHPSNKIFYDVANLQFMLNEKIVPNHLIESELDFDKTIKIPRSSGDLNDGYFVENSALRVSKSMGDVYSYVKFNEPKTNFEMIKHVKLYELFNINNIKSFNLIIPQLNKDDYDFNHNYEFLSNELIDKIIESFNQKMIDFMKQFISNFKDYDVVEDLDCMKHIFTIK